MAKKEAMVRIRAPRAGLQTCERIIIQRSGPMKLKKAVIAAIALFHGYLGDSVGVEGALPLGVVPLSISDEA